MRFINRTKELTTLNNEYNKIDSSFVVIYGRRRTGKTTLIREFIKNKKGIYYFADIQSETMQMADFKEQVSNLYPKDEFFRSVKISTWEALFQYIGNKSNPEERTIIVIDEFQNICKENKAFPSILQKIWDMQLKDRNIMIILCGSLISMMYETALNYSSPLYGRRTAQINLKPISFYHYKEFFEENNKNIVELVEWYSVTGGIPKYIEILDRNKSIKDNIENSIIDVDHFLYYEPRFLLKEEISDASTYFSILKVIAEGNHKIGNIATRLEIQVNNLTSFISKLIELEIIEKLIPVTEEFPSKSKKGLYFIKDNYINFWFKYIFPNESYISIGNIRHTMNEIDKNFNEYVSTVYETICRENLIRAELPFDVLKTGKWWDNNEEIDIIYLGSNNEILFGECKWTNEKLGISVLNALKSKAIKVEYKKNNREEYFVLFSKNGFTDDLIKLATEDNRVLLMNLENIIKAK